MGVLVADTDSVIPGADITVPGWAWAALIAAVIVMLLIDLLVFNREVHEISIREAAISSSIWVGVALAFGLIVLASLGADAAGQYYAGWAIEKSLSVDNVFVWAVVFNYFAVGKAYQHRVLFWGVFGALILRAVFIFAGVALLESLEWVIYIFGAFLLITAYRMLRADEEQNDPTDNPVFRFIKNRVPVTDDYRGSKFIVIENGRRMATPLMLVLIVVELTDVIFAVDSVPAILAISRSEFIVFSSNAFAILGLRALYFLLAGAADKLVYLNEGLAIILGFVGVKMLLAQRWHIPTGLSLGFVAFVMVVTVLLSLRANRRRAGL